MQSALASPAASTGPLATPAPKRLNVLMVWPYRERGIAAQMFDYTLKITRFKEQIPPVGLLTVAGYLPSYWNLTLVDLNVRPVTDEEIDRADFVFISGIIGQEKSLVETARRVRARGKYLIGGGSYINSSHFRVQDELDTICVGEAEPYIAELVADMEAGKPKARYGNGDKLHFDQFDVKPPRWDLLGKRAQKQYFLATIETSRGCPFNCEFCDIISVFGRKPRYKTPEQVRRELDALYAGGWRGVVAIIDDNLIGGNKECARLLDTLVEWQKEHDHPFYFAANVSMNMAEHDDHIAKFLDAGIRIIFVGVESPNVESLKETGKRQNIRGDMLERLHKLIRAGFELEYGMIIGFDHDSVQTLDAIDEFIEKSNVPNALFQILQALDNTALYDRLKAEGRLKENAGHDVSSIFAGRTNFVTSIDEEALANGYARVLAHVYDPAVYYDRTHRFVLELGERHRDKVKFPDFSFSMVNLLHVVLNLTYAIGRWPLFWNGMRVLAKGGWWRFFKYHQYVLGGMSYVEHYQRIVKAIRTHQKTRDLSLMPPEDGGGSRGGGQREEKPHRHAPAIPVGRLPVVP